MLFDGLHLPFRWYDDILKQNRYLAQCENNCTFKLITSECRLLPFMIKTSGVTPLVLWEIISEDGQTTHDISSCINLLQVITINGSDYIIYTGDYLTSCLTIPCGTWYSVISDGSNSYYSELFTVTTMTDVAFEQMEFDLHLPWRWYDDRQKQNRYKVQCENNCGWYLLSPNASLPPFQIRRDTIPDPITSWTLEHIDGNCTITLDPSLINIVTIGDYDYLIYSGDAIDDLLCGYWESIISDGVNTFYSELIEIRTGLNTNAFLLQENNGKILQENGGGIKLE